jgi:hypothetical protein
MARHSLEPQVCRRMSSSNCSWHSLSDSSHRRSASTSVPNKHKVTKSTMHKIRKGASGAVLDQKTIAGSGEISVMARQTHAHRMLRMP